MVDFHLEGGFTQFASVGQQSLDELRSSRPGCGDDLGVHHGPNGFLTGSRQTTKSRNQRWLPNAFGSPRGAGEQFACRCPHLCGVATPDGAARARMLVGQCAEERALHQPMQLGDVVAAVMSKHVILRYAAVLSPELLDQREVAQVHEFRASPWLARSSIHGRLLGHHLRGNAQQDVPDSCSLLAQTWGLAWRARVLHMRRANRVSQEMRRFRRGMCHQGLCTGQFTFEMLAQERANSLLDVLGLDACPPIAEQKIVGGAKRPPAAIVRVKRVVSGKLLHLLAEGCCLSSASRFPCIKPRRAQTPLVGIPGPVAPTMYFVASPFREVIELTQIGSKGGALRHCWRTFPPSALRTGRATRRCTRLARIALSPCSGCRFGSPPSLRMVLSVTFLAEQLHPLFFPGCDHRRRASCWLCYSPESVGMVNDEPVKLPSTVLTAAGGVSQESFNPCVTTTSRPTRQRQRLYVFDRDNVAQDR